MQKYRHEVVLTHFSVIYQIVKTLIDNHFHLD